MYQKNQFMNKSCTLILFLLGITSVLHAQTYYKAGITFGSNYSTLRSDLFTTAGGRLGLAGGFSIALGFGDKMELNTEILFTQKGASARAVRFLPEKRVENNTYNYYYSTFEAALFGGYFPFESIPLQFQAGGFFGSHYSRLDQLEADLWVDNYEVAELATQAIKLNNAFSGVDFGPAAGISAGNGRLRFNARYYLGLKNLYTNLDFVKPGRKIHTGSFRVTLSCFLK
jgi:hypothetical protein